MTDDSLHDMPRLSERPTVISPLSSTTRNQGAFTVGDIVGKYRILNLLGGGGMGSVFLAWDTKLNRQVAIKVPFSAAKSESQRRQLQAEIDALVKLNHPGIVPVFDLLETHGHTCLVMAYVEGVTLDQYAAQHKLSYRAIAESGVVDLVDETTHVNLLELACVRNEIFCDE